MIGEGINKIEALVKAGMVVNQFNIEGRKYTDRALVPIPEPEDETRTVTTLTGLVNLIQLNINAMGLADSFVQVVNPRTVLVGEIQCNDWGKRQYHVKAELPSYGAFPFGDYLEQEKFIIGLQAFFKQDALDMEYLYEMAGKLKAENVSTSDDDGITQQASIRKGAVLAQNVQVKKFVTLNPWRTFREIAQPESTFIFRLKNRDGDVPLLSLHVADGEMWQVLAMQGIKDWLVDRLETIKVIA